MASKPEVDRLLPLMREFGALERKRVSGGVTPVEYQRWIDLRIKLDSSLSAAAERRAHPRVPTRMLIQYRSRDHLRDAIITNISRGGMFISTTAGPEIGECFTLCIRVASTNETVEIPCEVVSQNVGNSFSTECSGVGVKFTTMTPGQRAAVDELFTAAAGAAYGAAGDE